MARADLLVDPQRLAQAVIALADNAVQHTGPGDRIVIGSRLSGDRLLVWVDDAGPGVAEADQERIFERFARGSSAARRSDGAGLGLSIVQAIAAGHGGHGELHSRQGNGATFTLDLPARPAPPRDAAPADLLEGPEDTVDESLATPPVDAGARPVPTEGGSR